MKKAILLSALFSTLSLTAEAQLITTADCPTSAVIFPGGSYLMTFDGTAGTDNTEFEAADCFLGSIESNSRWVRWVCPVDATITFTITPVTESDDLDFVLFSLGGGVDQCGSKTVVRCEAAGDFSFPSPCMGQTGLKIGETDFSEASGCSGVNNNFLAPLIAKAGEAFALGINDFTSGATAKCVLKFGGIVATSETARAAQLLASPNPTTGAITVFFEKKGAGQTRLQLFDLRGRFVFEKERQLAPGRQAEPLDLEGLPAGTYLLRISDGQEAAVCRVLKI